MRVLRSLLSPVFAAILAAGLISSGPARAQLPTPTPEQLEMLKNMSPEEREQLLRQITGGGGSDIGGTLGTSRDRDRDRDRADSDRLDRSLDRSLDPRFNRMLAGDEDTQNGIPVMKGDDWVIIKIDLPPEHPEQQQPNSQQPGAAPGTVPPGTAAPPNAVLPNQQVYPGSVPGSATGNTAPVSRFRAVELSQEEKEKRKKLIDLIRARNPYRLTPDGVLQLPGFTPIALAGLTEFQATVRLQADPELRDFDISIIRLPLKKIGTEALKPFGYDLFERAPSTFAPVTNVPVPADYIVGPGDELQVQLYGNTNRSLRLTVGRDGQINLPELGPVRVSGKRFTEAAADIEGRVARQMIGVRASVAMGDTRSIRIYVFGEAKRPGSYTISGLGTITSSLYAAGGVKPIGSLRNIQLKRSGQTVRTLDLYDMLIRGDSTDDAKLLPGDIVFIPPVGNTISVSGEVRRPAIYESKGESTIADIIQLAGGLTPEADGAKVSLTRIDEKRQRIVLPVDLTRTNAPSQTVRNGDLLVISRIKPTLDSGVVVDGYVYSPATYAYREGLRLSDVIHSVDDLKPNADIHYVIIRRELPPNREIAIVSSDLGAALQAPGTAADTLLMPRDRVTVFDLESGRDRIIRPIVNELKTQSTYGKPTELVTIDGRVKVPGEYPLEPGMTVSDLVRAGGGLSDAAYGGKAELTRYRVVNGDLRRTEQINIDLGGVLRGDAEANILLEAFDNLSIREVPEWGSQENVVLQGEVRFPGKYSIKRGETLKSVIARAGGLTDYAFAEGTVFTRDELKVREQKQLDMLASRLQNDLVTLALQGAAANQAQAGTALTVGQSLLAQLRTSEAVGRLVIDLPRALRAPAGSGADVILRDGDRLIVPKFQQEVTVIGEVQTATSHLFRPELGRDDYVALSGGETRRADHDHVYVVRADGSVVAREGGRWFSRSNLEMRPGDTIVVPLDTERIPALPFWQAVTQIIYNLAISAAAVNSF